MRVLFVIGNYMVGGTRTSLFNLLPFLIDRGIDVDLLVLSPHGLLADRLDHRIEIIETPRKINLVFTSYSDSPKKDYAIKILYSLYQRISGKANFIMKLTKELQLYCVEKQYDAVVGFQEGDCVNVAAMLPSKTHICWIHNNYKNIGVNARHPRRRFACH